ncbi:methyl-accepting chemotaxis protein [Rheinheimera pacifica]|uniref:methyl-accepting chemotaxis protein n=1 Tax=Rheinheimera pacifica TaxID=173990 RepID=UPI00286EAAB2|nr:PAS domain-containing methyl-accepting chemotaxis protein [Rheinheimera pacifica]MCS4306188.1 methyl-accepting chemotaxis protein [Rheinheimera pacifica]
MFNTKLKAQLLSAQAESSHYAAVIAAMRNSVALICFTRDGVIEDANDLFLKTVGYTLEQIKGQHHAMFCESAYANGSEYKAFWQSLGRGEAKHGTFLRKTNGGKQIWLEATYFPVQDSSGKVCSVMKIAYDITRQKQEAEAQKAIYSAIDKAMAVIEFTPDGTIVNANQNFLQSMGYRLEQIKHKHHRMLCDDSFYRENPDFWQQLALGKLSSGKFKRVDAHGNEVWLEATYNPVLDAQGKVHKVIKFATLITNRVMQAMRTREAARVAHETATETFNVAEQGKLHIMSSTALATEISATVLQTDTVIQSLNEQAKEIANMVSIIRSVAEQTNLLALNAAIEAARAGEAGRGFAVVADEVRQLASRTSQATSDISSVVSRNLEVTQNVLQAINSIDGLSKQNGDKINQLSAIIDDIERGAQRVVESVSAIQ